MNLQFYIEKSDYSDWYAVEQNTLERKEIELNPFENKIFSGDVYNYKDNSLNIVHSPIRKMTSIPGVLILEKIKHMVIHRLKIKSIYINVYLMIKDYQNF